MWFNNNFNCLRKPKPRTLVKFSQRNPQILLNSKSEYFQRLQTNIYSCINKSGIFKTFERHWRILTKNHVYKRPDSLVKRMRFVDFLQKVINCHFSPLATDSFHFLMHQHLAPTFIWQKADKVFDVWGANKKTPISKFQPKEIRLWFILIQVFMAWNWIDNNNVWLNQVCSLWS